MNRKQKVAVVVGALVIAGLALFPHYYEERTRWPLDARSATRERLPAGVPGLTARAADLGHHLVFDPPPCAEGQFEQVLPRIDTERLGIYVTTALLLTVAAVLVLKDRKA